MQEGVHVALYFYKSTLYFLKRGLYFRKSPIFTLISVASMQYREVVCALFRVCIWSAGLFVCVWVYVRECVRVCARTCDCVKVHVYVCVAYIRACV